MSGALHPSWAPGWTATALRGAGLEPEPLMRFIDATLDEDLRWGGDVTTESVLGPGLEVVACVVTRSPGTLAGVPVSALVPCRLAARSGRRVRVEPMAHDGQEVGEGAQVLRMAGPAREILTAERAMLNLLGQLSGVATATAAWVRALRGHRASVRDTRKTVPGMRVLQKYAVRCGGGLNHRMGLGDAALIKDNHIAAAGGIAAALRAVRQHAGGIDCEVECDTPAQVREAVAAGARLVLLDNMSVQQLAESVAVCRPAGVRTEASGTLRLPEAPAVASTGVDYVSVGALTHSAPVLDVGLDLR